MGGVRPNASENSHISLSTTVRAARVDGSRPNLASVLPEGRKNASIHASTGAIWGIPVNISLASVPVALHPGLFLAKSRGWLPDVEIEDGTLAKGRQAADLEQLRMEGMICRMSLRLITARRSVW